MSRISGRELYLVKKADDESRVVLLDAWIGHHVFVFIEKLDFQLRPAGYGSDHGDIEFVKGVAEILRLP